MYKFTILTITDNPEIISAVNAIREGEDKYIFTPYYEGSWLDIRDERPDIVITDEKSYPELCKLQEKYPDLCLMVIAEKAENKIYPKNRIYDFIFMPLENEELKVRLEMMKHRLYLDEHLTNGSMIIDRSHKNVSVGGRDVELTRTEYRLLVILSENIGKTVSIESILSDIWGDNWGSDPRSLRVAVSHLRKKLAKHDPDHEYVRTIFGRGYLMPVI